MGGGQHRSPASPSPSAEPISMQHAENWLLRRELVSLSRTAISAELTPADLSLGNNPAGFPEGLSAFAALFNERFHAHAEVLPDRHVVTGPGAGGCLMTMLPLLCAPGDAVLIPRPYWNGFDAACHLAGTVPVPVQVSEDLHRSTDGGLLMHALEEAIESHKGAAMARPRVLLFTNPGNPIGRCFERRTIADVLSFCQRHDLHLISDEVYGLTSYRAPDLQGSPAFHSVLSFDLEKLSVDASRVHVVWSVSKNFGLSGLRYGAMISQGNPALVSQLSARLNQCTSALSSLVASHLLRSPSLPELLALNSQRLKTAYELITSFFRTHRIEYVPCDSALYVCARIAPRAETWDDEDAAVARLAEVGVVVFGLHRWHPPETAKGWARFNFAIPNDDLLRALQRMETIYNGSAKAA